MHLTNPRPSTPWPAPSDIVHFDKLIVVQFSLNQILQGLKGVGGGAQELDMPRPFPFAQIAQLPKAAAQGSRVSSRARRGEGTFLVFYAQEEVKEEKWLFQSALVCFREGGDAPRMWTECSELNDDPCIRTKAKQKQRNLGTETRSVVNVLQFRGGCGLDSISIIPLGGYLSHAHLRKRSSMRDLGVMTEVEEETKQCKLIL